MTKTLNQEAKKAQTGVVAEGKCTCDHVHYRVLSRPLIVHGCHCTLCQKQSGAAYAVNALIEADRVELVSGTVRDVHVTTPSGAGQTITRCAECGVAVWSKYHALPKVGNQVLFIRAGTLEAPEYMPPDVHIHTSSKQPHVVLSQETPAYERFYDLRKTWSAEGLERYARMIASQDR